MKHSVRDVGVAGSNPATPTTGFTNRFKRLVNFLKLRKNIKQSRWHTFGTARLICGDTAQARAKVAGAGAA